MNTTAREYGDGLPVEIVKLDESHGWNPQMAGYGRTVIKAKTDGGARASYVDLDDVVTFYLKLGQGPTGSTQ